MSGRFVADPLPTFRTKSRGGAAKPALSRKTPLRDRRIFIIPRIACILPLYRLLPLFKSLMTETSHSQ